MTYLSLSHPTGVAAMKQDPVPQRRWLRRLWHRADGSISVELALVLPILVLIGLGAFDFGRAFQEKHRLAGAARAGAQYAMQHSAPEDIVDIIQSARDDAADTDGALDVTARFYCTCPTSGELTCGDPCPNAAESSFTYVDVDVRQELALLFTYPGISDEVKLRGNVKMRVR